MLSAHRCLFNRWFFVVLVLVLVRLQRQRIFDELRMSPGRLQRESAFLSRRKRLRTTVSGLTGLVFFGVLLGLKRCRPLKGLSAPEHLVPPQTPEGQSLPNQPISKTIPRTGSKRQSDDTAETSHPELRLKQLELSTPRTTTRKV